MSDYHLFKSCKPALVALGKIRIRDSVDPINGRNYVYQRVKPGLGNVECVKKDNLQLRLNPPQFDPQTPGQLAQRQKLIDANTAWHQLSPEERRLWDYGHNPKNLPGYHWFLSCMMR